MSSSTDLLRKVREQSGALNLSTLQRNDAHISRLLHTGKHVVLYRLNESNSQWERLEIEGPCFIVERISIPYYRMIILNRRDIQNYTESVTFDMLFELQNQYVFFPVSSKGEVMGLWFSEEPEAQQAEQILTQCVTRIKDTTFKPQPITSAPSSSSSSISPSQQPLQYNNTQINSNVKKSTSSSRTKKPAPVNTQKPLLPHAPPPQIEYDTALSTSDERALAARLNSFMKQFHEEDDAFQQAHDEARRKQMQPSVNAAISSTKPTTTPTASSIPTTSSNPQPFRFAALLSSLQQPISDTDTDALPPMPIPAGSLSVAELEKRALSQQQQQQQQQQPQDHHHQQQPAAGNSSTSTSTAHAVHPLLSALFQSAAAASASSLPPSTSITTAPLLPPSTTQAPAVPQPSHPFSFTSLGGASGVPATATSGLIDPSRFFNPAFVNDSSATATANASSAEAAIPFLSPLLLLKATDEDSSTSSSSASTSACSSITSRPAPTESAATVSNGIAGLHLFSPTSFVDESRIGGGSNPRNNSNADHKNSSDGKTVTLSLSIPSGLSRAQLIDWFCHSSQLDAFYKEYLNATKQIHH